MLSPHSAAFNGANTSTGFIRQSTAALPPRNRSPPGRQAFLRAQDAKRGLVANLGDVNTINQSGSILRHETWIGPGASNHPVLIIDILSGNIALCLQCTSWTDKATGNHQTIRQKWSKVNDKHTAALIRGTYLAINRHSSTEPHDKLPVLQLDNGQQMLHQTYVHTTSFFRIEISNLKPWQGNKSFLDTDSLGTVTAYFEDICQATFPRPPLGRNQQPGPLDKGVVVNLSPNATSDAAYGRTLPSCPSSRQRWQLPTPSPQRSGHQVPVPTRQCRAYLPIQKCGQAGSWRPATISYAQAAR